MTASIVLLAVSIASGIALLWMFSRTSDQARIRTTKKRLQARLLELRLYADDPRVVLRAQRALLAENLRYFGLMMRPAVILTVPMILVLIVLDGFYGKRPIGPGESAVVTVQMNSALGEETAAELRVPESFTVETGAARVLPERQVSWRIRAAGDGSGELHVVVGDEEVTKKIASGSGFHYLSSRRVGSLLSWFLYPGEMPIGAGSVDWVEVDYPANSVSYYGLSGHWLVWFMLFSMAAAFLLKGRFGVTV